MKVGHGDETKTAIKSHFFETEFAATSLSRKFWKKNLLYTVVSIVRIAITKK